MSVEVCELEIIAMSERNRCQNVVNVKGHCHLKGKR